MSSAAEGPSCRRPLDEKHPFPGLRPYEEEDASWFFGRGQAINDLLKRLRRVHFLAVVGPSGFGKSSLVKAGLLPAIRDGYLDAEWRIALLTPGNHPLENLAAALGAALPCEPAELRKQMERGPVGLVEAIQGCKVSNKSVLVVVDQFEELFQLVLRKGEAGQEETKAFLRLLLTVAASDAIPFYVVITMRLEWLSECSSYPGLAEAINEGGYLVPQMTRRQFQQAILKPVEAARGSITATLSDRLLNDLDGRTDQLPVLQHVLMRMWGKKKPGTPLDVADYEAIGALSRSLSNHAEEVFGGLDAKEKGVAEALFRSITQVSKNRKLRKPMPLGEIADKTGAPMEKLKKVVEAFAAEGRSFLVVLPGVVDRDSIIDISHEALIRQWGRLGHWVDDEAELVSRVNRLEETASEWDSGKRSNGALLYRGPVLKKAEELTSRLKPDSVCMSFLKASRRAQLWNHIWWRGSVVALSVALAVVLGFYLKTQKRNEQNRAYENVIQQQRKGLQRVAQESQNWQEAVATSLEPSSRPAIFLQYPGAEQLELAKAVQAYLKGQGYSVPELEAVGSHTPQSTQVRYFYSQDMAEAEKLANVLRSFIAGSVKTQLTAYNSESPPPSGQLEIWLSAVARSFSRISVKHLVVLMLEGRAFDHMLGFLKNSDYAIDGLSGNESNPDNYGTQVRVSNDAVRQGDFIPDPGHSFPDVNFQIFGSFEDSKYGQMQGFVKSYGFHTAQVASSHKIMKCMGEAVIPVLSILAKQYAVCDRWFSSVPGPSFPNRAFVHAGTSIGRVDSSVSGYWAIPKTVYELMGENGISARIYYHDSTLALTFRGLQQKPGFFGTFQDFLDSCKNGTLPMYAFIEPRYMDGVESGIPRVANDEHADHDMGAGEQLIHDVYQAIRSNKEVWESSILVITYSQHGGFYDHVVPPATVSPDGVVAQDPGQGVAKIPPFYFTQLGVRVPAVIISPFIEPGTIDHTVYDHTSVIATARKLFLGKAAATSYLTERDRLANTFDHLLTRPTPRTDNPIP
jgi:phospholipase C